MEEGNKLKTEQVRCKNLFCSAMDITITKDYSPKIGDMKCPSCGYKGFMPYSHILKADEIILQILKKQKTVLWKDLFKQINYEKLPRSLEQQNLDDGTRYDIDIIAIGIKKEEGQ